MYPSQRLQGRVVTVSFHSARNRLVALALVSVVGAMVVAWKTPVTVAEHAELYPTFAAMRREIGTVDRWNDVWTPEMERTRHYYAACTRRVSGALHDAGSVDLDGERIAVHRFIPPSVGFGDGGPTNNAASRLNTGVLPRGIVFLVHGYLSHVQDYHPLIRSLLQEGYVVVAPELPGHGLSGGIRGGIESFSRYGSMVATVIEQSQPPRTVPWSIIGHSTGAVAILEYLRDESDPFNAVVFAAPLVRSRMYNAARVGRWISRPFMDTVNTKYDSPLGVSRMPLSWFDALVAWNRTIPDGLSFDREIMVLQGNRDRVLAWRYNRRVIAKLFPYARYEVMRGATHILYQESTSPLRDRAIAMTIAYLSEETGDDREGRDG